MKYRTTVLLSALKGVKIWPNDEDHANGVELEFTSPSVRTVVFAIADYTNPEAAIIVHEDEAMPVVAQFRRLLADRCIPYVDAKVGGVLLRSDASALLRSGFSIAPTSGDLYQVAYQHGLWWATPAPDEGHKLTLVFSDKLNTLRPVAIRTGLAYEDVVESA